MRLSDDTIVYPNFGPALRSALGQKRRATAHYAGPGSPRGGKLEQELRQTYNNGSFNKSAVAAKSIHITWEEDEDDAWL